MYVIHACVTATQLQHCVLIHNAVLCWYLCPQGSWKNLWTQNGRWFLTRIGFSWRRSRDRSVVTLISHLSFTLETHRVACRRSTSQWNVSFERLLCLVTRLQVWLALYQLLMKEECQRKYELDPHRKNTLLKVRTNYMHCRISFHFYIRRFQKCVCMSLRQFVSTFFPFCSFVRTCMTSCWINFRSWQRYVNIWSSCQSWIRRP